MTEYHKIYNDHPYIEDEFFNLIYIPLMDKYDKVSGYAISNLALKDKLLKFSYHQVIYLTKTERRYAVSNLGPSMHEIVIGKKADEGYVIDHFNGNGLLNTEENLRYATHGLNAQNKEKLPNTSSNYIGVSFGNNKWISTITYNKERFNLGSFEDEIEAAKVYDIHAIYYYKGQSPKTNDLLTKNEIDDIRRNGIPKKYQKKIRDLPKNIQYNNNNNGTYNVRITRGEKTYNKTVKTLEEAILLKKQILEEIEKNQEISKYNKLITKNINGLAIIYMSNGMECLVDEAHWYDIMQYKWNWYKDENSKMYGYPSGTVDGKTIGLHIYVYEKYVGEIPYNMTVDHVKSKDILDVRLQNLRLADRSLQAHNRILSKNRVDEYKGIQFSTSGYSVMVNGNYYGIYKVAEEAAKKANEIYTQIYGDQATLNVIDDSKTTTIYNRIPEENITKEYIIGLNKVCDVRNVIIIKKLNCGGGGKITLDKVKLKTLNEYKQIIINTLYPI